MADGDFITIAPRELYDTLRRLEGKVDLLGAAQEKLADHETRIRALESRFVGVAVAAVTTVLAAVGAIVWKVVGS